MPLRAINSLCHCTSTALILLPSWTSHPSQRGKALAFQAAKGQCISPSSENHGELRAFLKGAANCAGNRTIVWRPSTMSPWVNGCPGRGNRCPLHLATESRKTRDDWPRREPLLASQRCTNVGLSRQPRREPTSVPPRFWVQVIVFTAILSRFQVL